MYDDSFLLEHFVDYWPMFDWRIQWIEHDAILDNSLIQYLDEKKKTMSIVKSTLCHVNIQRGQQQYSLTCQLFILPVRRSLTSDDELLT
jgi:hypothetical protein